MATAAVLAATETERFRTHREQVERILTRFDTTYTWDYTSSRPGLHELYEKAKREQWNATTQLAWNTDVDPEAPLIKREVNPFQGMPHFERMSEKERARFQHANLSWQLSQFMHGEQGALVTASQLVGAVPWIDAKYYAATQTMDEARHVEVFSRYLLEKLEWEWPINPNLRKLLDLILCDSRWDFKYLGMQILVEGLAMAAFAALHQSANEPLLKDLIHYVMRDESRHVAFGVLSLKGYYDDMPESERCDREDFTIESCLLMRDRLIGEEVGVEFGFERDEFREVALSSPLLILFRQLLFMRVVPNIKRLGLLTPRVRKAFEEMKIIQFEDTDPEAHDRQLGIAS
jgi:hypothetical protein